MTGNNGLPQSWESTTIGEIVSFEYGKGLRKDRRDETGEFPVYGSNGIVGYHTEALVDTPCLVVGRKGTAGAVHLSKVPCWPIDTTYYVIPPEGVSLGFLYHLLSSLQLEKLDKSTAIPGLNRNDAYAVEIALPPLPEQERIVAKIEETFTQLEAGVAELQNAKAQLKRYRAAVLKSAVEGELTREWREAHQDKVEPAEKLLARILEERRKKWESEGEKGKYKEPVEPNIYDLPELPDGWVWVNVGQIAEHRLEKMLDQAKNKGKPTPYLRNINVRWFEFDLSDLKHMRVTADELENVSVVKGDLVVCEGGEPGRAAVWEKAGEPFAIQKTLHRVRTAEGVLPKFLAYRLAADAWSGILKKYFTGSTIMHFTGQSLHSYTFALPPTQEQKLIIDKVERRLSVADEIEKELDESLVRAERLRGSILKNAFEGKL